MCDMRITKVKRTFSTLQNRENQLKKDTKQSNEKRNANNVQLHEIRCLFEI